MVRLDYDSLFELNRHTGLDHRDLVLSALVALHHNRVSLPASVNVYGHEIDLKLFLESFRTDTREAWPAITVHIETVQRPLVCEAALSLD